MSTMADTATCHGSTGPNVIDGPLWTVGQPLPDLRPVEIVDVRQAHRLLGRAHRQGRAP
ncbi:hypothetical protein [Amycolatopsis nalaikhensis]|uniref:Uncharacterized protein n=1 Tax=Amycolatopsis nalaikhensis TaxID=715472 RepID=A0ABY8XU35_9PSEU|nr:hypothetical protein [Amycolatopsis sp. 2-2]WIV59144.1 hypothetical protein QP939_11195 [Amycolatopsis sp. 2-2]